MKLLKKIPFFLPLLAVFFCLHGSVENYGYINAGEVVQVGLIAIACIVLFFGICWLFTRNYLFASLITFFIALWYLFYGAIHDLIKTTSFLSFLQSYTFMLPLLLAFNIFVIWWLKRSKALYTKLFLYLNILFIIFCLADGFLLLNKHFSYKETAVENPLPFNITKVAKKPNVYFLLFDEYAGYKSLKDSFGFKNDRLYSFLKQHQFNELPTFSNYDFTPFSMSSVLNMQYVPENYLKNSLTQQDIQNRFGEIRNAQVFAAFKSMKYDIENYSIFDIKQYPALFPYNGLFPIHAGLLTNKLFHNRVIKGIGWRLFTGRFEIPFLSRHYMYRNDAYNKEVEQKVLKSAATVSVQPKFCYAHFLMPHGQYYRDSTGAYNTPAIISDLNFRKSKPIYLSYLKYTNEVIQNMVGNIVEKDPLAIVIVMSDHGFYDYETDHDFDPGNFNNICFVRYPGGKQGSVKLPQSNVNFFRYIFNSEYGQNFPYLPDSTVFVVEDVTILR
jgi:hypothetical protein